MADYKNSTNQQIAVAFVQRYFESILMSKNVSLFYSNDSEHTIVNERGEGKIYRGGEAISEAHIAMDSQVKFIFDAIDSHVAANGNIIVSVFGKSGSRTYGGVFVLAESSQSYYVASAHSHYISVEEPKNHPVKPNVPAAAVSKAEELDQVLARKAQCQRELELAQAKLAASEREEYEARKQLVHVKAQTSSTTVGAPVKPSSPVPEVVPEAVVVVAQSSLPEPEAAAPEAQAAPSPASESAPAPQEGKPARTNNRRGGRKNAAEKTEKAAEKSTEQAAATAPAAAAEAEAEKTASVEQKTVAEEKPEVPAGPTSWASRLGGTAPPAPLPKPASQQRSQKGGNKEGRVQKDGKGDATGNRAPRQQQGDKPKQARDGKPRQQGEESKSQPRGEKKPAGEIVPNVLYVQNLPASVTADQLKSHFEAFGTVTKVQIAENKTYALVTYQSADEAANAFKVEHALCGQTFTVRHSVKTPRRQSTTTGSGANSGSSAAGQQQQRRGGAGKGPRTTAAGAATAVPVVASQ